LRDLTFILSSRFVVACIVRDAVGTKAVLARPGSLGWDDLGSRPAFPRRRTPPLPEVVVPRMGAEEAAQLEQGLGLDLAHGLARQPQYLAHLLQRTSLSVVDPEAEPDHLLLTG